jgi:hypothetical protein
MLKTNSKEYMLRDLPTARQNGAFSRVSPHETSAPFPMSASCEIQLNMFEQVPLGLTESHFVG